MSRTHDKCYKIYSKGFTYTRGTTIETTYIRAASGTLKFCIYGRPLGLGANEQVLKDTVTITVKKNNLKLIKTIQKPSYTDSKLVALKVYYYKIQLFSKQYAITIP